MMPLIAVLKGITGAANYRLVSPTSWSAGDMLNLGPTMNEQGFYPPSLPPPAIPTRSLTSPNVRKRLRVAGEQAGGMGGHGFMMDQPVGIRLFLALQT